jgi:hypothetical protein
MKTDLTYLNECLEYYPNIDVIDYCNDCVLGFDMKTNKAYYLYKPNEDISFIFHLFCEIGQSFVPWFENAINSNQFKKEIKENENDYFEILIPII